MSGLILAFLLAMTMLYAYSIFNHISAAERKKRAKPGSPERRLAARQAADAAVIGALLSASLATMFAVVGIYLLAVPVAIAAVVLTNSLRRHLDDDDDWRGWQKKRAKRRLYHLRQLLVPMTGTLPSST